MIGLVKDLSQYSFIKVSTLCKSLGGVDIPMLTIDEKSDQKKKAMVIYARVHPGEANASFLMEGFLNLIVGDS